MKATGFYKICPVCSSQFRVCPSTQHIKTCSMHCGRLLAWSRTDYREQMSMAHKGKPSSFIGAKHTRESILKMRLSHFSGKEKILRKNGYIYCYSPDHPRQTNGRVPEQVLVVESALGRLLEGKEVVHHINGIKTDNRLENLQLMTDSDHRRLEAKLRGFGHMGYTNPHRDTITGKFLTAEVAQVSSR